MAFFKLLEIIEGGWSRPPTFGHSFLLMSRAPKSELVEISSLTLK